MTLLFVWLAPVGSAHAQSWLSDRRRAEGRGIRLGDFELHPGVGAEVGYLSNPFFSERPRSTPSLRVVPHIFLSTLRDERLGADASKPGWVNFAGGLSGSFQRFFRDDINVINVDLNADATFAPERPVSFRVTELLRRSAVPFGDTASYPTQAEAFRIANYTNYYENASAQLLFQTAGGLLRGGVGYRFGYTWFDDEGFAANSNMTHSATFNLGWEFLPKTALFYEALYSYQNYTNADDMDRQVFTHLVNNHQLLTRIGINGAITSRIGATLALGYSAGFYESGEEPEGLIGSLEGRYVPSVNSELALVLDRAFVPSYQGNFQDRIRGFARFRWLFVGALLLAARAGVEFLSFGYDIVQMSGRDDRRYFADINGEYRFVDWLALTMQAGVLVDDTDFAFRAINGALANPAKFTAVEAWLGVRAFL
ncbi:MAG: hypothetical protein ABW321_30415 [Polyangiales bacterium]